MNKKSNKEIIKSKLISNISEEVNTENIPICNNCLFEFEKGNYICVNCKINLCPFHAIEHFDNNKEHKYIYLNLIK
jgi:peptide methionine sulfoxide reductase MsrB